MSAHKSFDEALEDAVAAGHLPSDDPIAAARFGWELFQAERAGAAPIPVVPTEPLARAEWFRDRFAGLARGMSLLLGNIGDRCAADGLPLESAFQLKIYDYVNALAELEKLLKK